MSVVYHLSKKQVSRAFKVQNEKGVYLTDIKSYLDPNSIKEHTDVMPTYVYVREDTHSTPSNLLRWKPGVLTPPGGLVYGSIIFAYGDKTYQRVPEEKRITDAEVELLNL